MQAANTNIMRLILRGLFPPMVNFSAEQRAIYEIVLAAQLAGIKEVYPGSPWTAAQKNHCQNHYTRIN